MGAADLTGWRYVRGDDLTRPCANSQRRWTRTTSNLSSPSLVLIWYVTSNTLLITDAYCQKGCGTSARKGFLQSHCKFPKRHIMQVKTMAAFLSGEMKDTVQMNPAGAYGAHAVYSYFPTARC